MLLIFLQKDLPAEPQVAVHAALVGVDIQAFSAVTSVVKVVHVVPSHLPASTVGKDVLPLYVPESTQYEHQ